MSEEEQNELLKKAFANTLRKLAEEPEELFDNDKLQKKYNNLLKEQIKLKQELQQKENIIKEVREWAKKYSCQFTNDDGELVVSEISFNIQARPCDLFKILEKAGNSNERNKDNK